MMRHPNAHKPYAISFEISMKRRATRYVLAICVSLSMLPAAPPASAHDCVLKYETFEYAVPHIDLEKCPEAEMAKVAFCRASVGAEQVHLFYFENGGDQCLLKVRSFEEGRYSFDLKLD